jgi:hypothetical protein
MGMSVQINKRWRFVAMSDVGDEWLEADAKIGVGNRI